eukprot:gnl/TRDRNA2_/TRDRNA2_93483_c0_seq3.p1 gnl/TRDRNA2_/TRDRNA2_93483_c0~~gnl/TRDRNA2_/TRDRNA2_93483_c0_seq3.p1  ORF type:complete len:492 (+),score=96.34 gnl/TRDRNA2_/TRDRNA2_93483_c0_seq3:111-1586(+)
MAAEILRKMKAILLIAMLATAEVRKVQEDILINMRQTQQAEAMSPCLNFQQQLEMVAKHMEAMMANSNFQRQTKQAAEQLKIAMTDPNVQQQVKHLTEQIEVMMSDPSFQEQAKHLSEQLEATMGKPREEQVKQVVELMEAATANPRFEQQAKRVANQIEAIVASGLFSQTLREQAKSIAEHMETMMAAYDQVVDGPEHAKLSEQMQAILLRNDPLGKLLDRAADAPSPSHRINLDGTTLGKTSHLSSTISRVPRGGIKPAIHSSILRTPPTVGSKSLLLRMPSQRSVAVKDSTSGDDYSTFVEEKKKAGMALARNSRFSWWVQVILSVISAVMVAFAGVMSNIKDIAGPGLLLSASGLGLSVVGILRAWMYTRFGRALVKELPEAPKRGIIIQALRRGVGLHMLGMLLTLLSAQTLTGSLLAQSLMAFNPYAAGVGATNAFASSPITPLDVFALQANTNILLSHFAGLAFTTWVLFNDVWKPNPNQKSGT